MNINGLIVNTPFDVYPEYDADWRHKVAKAWAPNMRITVPDCVREDKWIVEHAAYLAQSDTKVLKFQDSTMHRIVHGWSCGGTVNRIRYRLEALLLTEVDYATIAKDLLNKRYPEQIIQYYERLFYDCREDDGSVPESPYRRMWLSSPNSGRLNDETSEDMLWKTIAYQLGYPGLVTHWRMTGCHGPKSTPTIDMKVMNELSLSIINERMLRGAISSRDLVELQKNKLEYEKHLQDNQGAVNLGGEYMGTLLQFLKFTYPRKYDILLDDDDKKRQDEMFKSRISAQQQVHSQNINDAGSDAVLQSLNTKMQEHVKRFTAEHAQADKAKPATKK
jgi:hypothetical protein